MNPPSSPGKIYIYHRQYTCTCSRSICSSAVCQTQTSQNHSDRLNANHRNLKCKIIRKVLLPATIQYPKLRLEATCGCQKKLARKNTIVRSSCHINLQFVSEYGSSFFFRIKRATKMKVVLFSSF